MAKQAFVPRQRQSAGGTPQPDAAHDGAAAIAVSALSFLASDPDHLERFMATTGLADVSIRTAAQAPDFLAGVLDYVVADEPLLVACAQSIGVAPAEVVRAQHGLSHGSHDMGDHNTGEWDHGDA